MLISIATHDGVEMRTVRTRCSTPLVDPMEICHKCGKLQGTPSEDLTISGYPNWAQS